MKENILFSTIGTSDPTRGEHDGPFLHIIRKYKPKKAFIFLTKEMCDNDDKDNRYEVEAKKIYPEIEIIKIKEYEMDNPHEFLIFDSKFEYWLDKLSNEYPDDQILVNISSGTPQMLCSLYNIAAHADRPYKLIQVKSPEKRANQAERVGIEYDLENNLDNSYDNFLDEKDGIENRCKEIEPTNVRKKLVEKIIMEQIKVYDYEGASLVANEAKYLINNEAIELIEFLKYRYKLQFDKFDNNMLPIQTSGVKSIFEYILYLDIKQKRDEIIDFTRGVSPVLTDLFEICLKEVYKVDIRKYCENRIKKINGKNISVPFLVKSKLPREVQILYDRRFTRESNLSGGFRDSELSSTNILPYIEYEASKDDDKTLYNCANLLREFEMKFRNIAAHQITSVSDESIKKEMNISSKKLVDTLKQLFKIAYGRNYGKLIDWNSYDNVNQQIIEKLK